MQIAVILVTATATVIKLCFARNVCREISDDVRGNFGLQEVNECYRCRGWYKVTGEVNSAYSSDANEDDDGIAWCAESRDNYLEVIFDEPTKLAGLRMNSTDMFHVHYVDENGEESFARNRLRDKLFRGDAEADGVKEYNFFIPVTATSVRVHIESYESRPCLVVQFYSCDHRTNQNNGITKRRRHRTNYALADYHVKKISRDRRRRKKRCSINVKRDCGSLECFQYRKDEDGCRRCECDLHFDGLMEGDIVIDSLTRHTAELEYGFSKDEENLMRNGITNDQGRWVDYPSGSYYIIPYSFDGSMEMWAQDKIIEAMRQMESVTCLKFQRRTSQQYFLTFYRGGGCSSYIGNIRASGGQKISIGNGCEGMSVIQHEILHALGFWHEQSRGDRDDYVKILRENIQSGREGNFEKRQTNNYASPYDFESIMHYGNTAFTANGQDTIRAIHNPELRLGTSNAMTTEDINQVNRMYQCQTTTTGSKASTSTSKTTTILETTTTSTVATTSAHTTSTTISACEDSYESCRYWTSVGYCKEKYVDFMHKNCKKSCKLCECQDTLDCSFLKDYCQDKSEVILAFMQEKCTRTCDLC